MQKNKKNIIVTIVLSTTLLSTIIFCNIKSYKIHKRYKHNIHSTHTISMKRDTYKNNINNTNDNVIKRIIKIKQQTNQKIQKIIHKKPIQSKSFKINNTNTKDNKSDQINKAKDKTDNNLNNKPSNQIKPTQVNTYNNQTKEVNRGGYDGLNTYYDIPLTHEQQDWIRLMCKQNDFSFELGISLCFIESDFKGLSINSCGAIGYYQVQQTTADEMLRYMSIHDKEQYNQAIVGFSLYDFKSNCRIALYLLRYLCNECHGDIQIALSRYNGQGSCYSGYSELVVSNCERLRSGLGLSRE